MATQTLLQLTQNILSSLDSDEVNSISDTTESMQVARIIESKYYDILARNQIPEQEMFLQLDSSVDATQPTVMTVPAGVTDIGWIKYFDANPADSLQVDQFGSYSHGVNTDIISSDQWSTTSTTSNSIAVGSKTFTVAASLSIHQGDGALITSGTNSMFGSVTSYSGTTLIINVTDIVGSGTHTSWTITSASSQNTPGYRYVEIIGLEDFLGIINRFSPSDDNVGSYTFTQGGNDFTLYYKNDSQPRWCTILENTYVLFDSFDSEFDTTLQASKVLAFGSKVTPFDLVDSFVPDLDDSQFSLLFNESKSLAFFELKQTGHSKAEQEIKRQWSTVQKRKSVSNKPTYFQQLPSFGRVPRTGGYGGGNPAYPWMRRPS